MPVAFEMSNWHPFHETFDEDRVPSFFFKGLGESDTLVTIEVVVEYFKVVFLDVEIYLIDEGLFKRFFTDWYFVGLGEER